ncbi:hypothetical protein ACLMJK_007018 [Lecanora helva]
MGRRKAPIKELTRATPSVAHPRGDDWQFVHFSPAEQSSSAEIRKRIRVNAMLHYRKCQRSQANRQRNRIISDDPSQPIGGAHLGTSHLASFKDEHEHRHHSAVDAASDRPYERDQSTGTAEKKEPSNASHTALDDGHDSIRNWDDLEPKGSDASTKFPTVFAIQALLGGKFDPFNSYPHSNGCWSSEVLHHFCTVIAKECLPIDRGPGADENPLRTSWVPTAISDPILFQATINYAAMHLDMCRGTENRVKSLGRKAQTIKMINEQLSRGHDMNNSIIGAIAMMASAENSRNSPPKIGDIARRHNELRFMGTSYMDFLVFAPAVLPGLIFIPEEQITNHKNQPRGHLLSSAMMDTQPWPELAPPCPVLGGLYSSNNAMGIDPAIVGGVLSPLVTHYYQLRRMTKWMHELTSSGTPISDSQMFNYCRYRHSVELSLLTLSEMGQDDKTSLRKRSDWTSHRGCVFEVQRVCALIYLNLVLRSCPPFGALRRALKSKLLSIVSFTRDSTAYAECQPRMAIWVYFVGGLLSLNDQEKLFFAENIAKTMHDAKLRTWVEVEKTLNEILWARGLQTTTCRNLWQKVVSSYGQRQLSDDLKQMDCPVKE